MSIALMDQQADRKYVKADPPKVLCDALDAQFRGPAFVAKMAGVLALVLLAAVALIAPFVSPLRETLGWYLYVHILIVIVVLCWLFIRVVPPPSRASENRRLRFMSRANDKRLGRAGLDASGISVTRIAPDGQTLEIVVTDDWLGHSPEVRLRDTQNFWWLWTTVYLPYDGPDKVFIRLLDSNGSEVGGSRPDVGSLVWTK